MKEVHISLKQDPLCFDIDPDIKADMERIRNPQDLNDALLSVTYDEAARQLAQQAIQNQLLKEIQKGGGK